MKKRLFGVLSRALLALCAACGGDDSGAGNNDQGRDEGSALAANGAGKACAGDGDCGPAGRCLSALTGGAVGALLGTEQNAPGGYCSVGCLDDATCGEGGLCFGMVAALNQEGECRKACASDASCGRAEYECAMQATPVMVGETAYTLASTCQPRVVPVAFTDQAGKACGADGDCAGGICRTGDAYPGGYCSGPCNADSDCGAGGVCINGGYGSGGTCAEGCNTDSDCARDDNGYGCVAYGEVKVCGVKADPLPNGIVGTACSADGACGGGACATELSIPAVPAPGGYCSQLNCSGDDAQCGAGGECITSALGSRCYKGCTRDDQCRVGYACSQRGTGETAAKVCFPLAASAGTPDSGVADAG